MLDIQSECDWGHLCATDCQECSSVGAEYTANRKAAFAILKGIVPELKGDPRKSTLPLPQRLEVPYDCDTDQNHAPQSSPKAKQKAGVKKVWSLPDGSTMPPAQLKRKSEELKEKLSKSSLVPKHPFPAIEVASEEPLERILYDLVQQFDDSVSIEVIKKLLTVFEPDSSFFEQTGRYGTAEGILAGMMAKHDLHIDILLKMLNQ